MASVVVGLAEEGAFVGFAVAIPEGPRAGAVPPWGVAFLRLRRVPRSGAKSAGEGKAAAAEPAGIEATSCFSMVAE